MPALISTIENFLDIHEKATTSGDFSPNKVMAKKIVNGIIGCHGNRVFDAIFGEILHFQGFFSIT